MVKEKLNKEKEEVSCEVTQKSFSRLLLSLSLIGSRLAVSALISVIGYHIPSVDISACTEEHNMDSTHFLSWLDSTCATLRKEIGELTYFEPSFPLIISDRAFLSSSKPYFFSLFRSIE
jgi:hypothetical protein